MGFCYILGSPHNVYRLAYWNMYGLGGVFTNNIAPFLLLGCGQIILTKLAHSVWMGTDRDFLELLLYVEHGHLVSGIKTRMLRTYLRMYYCHSCLVENTGGVAIVDGFSSVVLFAGATCSSRLISCFNTLYLFCKVKPELLIPHANTIQPYLDIKCSVSHRLSQAVSMYNYAVPISGQL